MPTFEIPDGPTSVDVDRPVDRTDPKNPKVQTGETKATYSVTNKTGDPVAGELSVLTAGASDKAWFSIDGPTNRTFTAGETQTAVVKISIPPEVKGGDYQFRLRAVTEADPDNDHAEGPVTTAHVKAVEAGGGGSKLWLWILLAVLALALIGGLVWWFLIPPDDDPVENKTDPTPVAEKVVPDYVGAKTPIDKIPTDDQGYKIVKAEQENTGNPPRVVVRQSPDPKTPLKAGEQVTVFFEPGVPVPNLAAGSSIAIAKRTLHNANLEVGEPICDVENSGKGTLQPGSVAGYSPAPMTMVALHSRVNLKVVQETRCLIGIIPRDVYRKYEVLDRPRTLNSRSSSIPKMVN